jgi:hypothetical protein
MAFSGDYVEIRRHTAGLDLDELDILVARAVETIITRAGELAAWQESLKEVPVSWPEFKILTFDAMKEGVFPPSRFGRFLECVEEETAANPSTMGTMYHFHSSVTRLLRQDSLFTIAERTVTLGAIVSDFALF